jgi:hypothetical protein
MSFLLHDFYDNRLTVATVQKKRHSVEQLVQALFELKKNYNMKRITQQLGHHTPLGTRKNACSPPQKVT